VTSTLKNVRISEEVPYLAVEVVHVSRDGGHFRQGGHHVAQGDYHVRQEFRASGGLHAKEGKKREKTSEKENPSAKAGEQ
jgi:hypothetical protein